MATIGTLLADAHDRDGVAFTAPARTTAYSYRDFTTASWKAGNLLRHYGVHEGSTVTVLFGPGTADRRSARGELGETPEPLFAVLGAWLLGAVVDVDPDGPDDGAAVVCPAQVSETLEVAPGCSMLVYGDTPSDPTSSHFERERWSENPVEPPNHVSADAGALVGTRETQRTLVETARSAVAEAPIRPGDKVGIDGAIGPETLSFGVLAPVVAGATIVGGDTVSVDVRVDGDRAHRLNG